MASRILKETLLLVREHFCTCLILKCFSFAGIFTVMCYNVLCDKYATRQMYGYCPSWALEWDYRKKGILDEIRHYSADIISLQVSEIDKKLYFLSYFLNINLIFC